MEPLDIFKASGAMLDGHFSLTSGRHSDRYLEKFNLLQWPEYTEKICKLMADFGRDFAPKSVAGPTTGGVLLAYEVARQIGVRGLFCEKDPDGGRSFQRGFSFSPGEAVLVVDDIVTTGGSLVDTIAAVRNAGADPVAVVSIADRTGGKIDLGLPFFAALTIEIPSWESSECPKCLAGEPITHT
ncbi:MAG: orotate phosphoribosyltransferase [Chloroflexi bacterium]|nr:orotate phosphoribosyltransferase [Chloroflexota bacterium]